MGNLKDGDGKTIPQSLNAETFGFKITNDISKKANITLSYDAYKSDFMYLDNFYGGGIFINTSKLASTIYITLKPFNDKLIIRSFINFMFIANCPI